MGKSDFEVRCNVKFLTQLGWDASQIIEALHKVYANASPHRGTVFRWMKRFKEGREDLKDDPREGRPSTPTNEENVAAVLRLVEEDRRISIDAVAAEVGISHGSAFSILSNHLGLSKLSARWVPRALRDEQLVQRADLSNSILLKIQADEDAFMGRIVIGDETWIYQYDPESKIQSKQWLPRGSAGPVKFKAERSVQKVMATIFWYPEGIILVDFPEGQSTITGACYEGVLRKLKATLIGKRPRKLHRGIIFHHDNAPAHSCNATRTVLREFRWETLPHPPYSPDLAPSDFFLFPKLKETLKGKRFSSLNEAKISVLTWCRETSQEFFGEGMGRWKHRLQKCLDLDGGYVEKN